MTEVQMTTLCPRQCLVGQRLIMKINACCDVLQPSEYFCRPSMWSMKSVHSIRS